MQARPGSHLAPSQNLDRLTQVAQIVAILLFTQFDRHLLVKLQPQLLQADRAFVGLVSCYQGVIDGHRVILP